MIEQLGEFSIRRELGEGGMGAVLLGYQESLDREVAIKVLTERLCKNETYIARFRREARSAASIVHPNVIQIYSIGEDNGTHFFAMEYVKGTDLSERVAQGKRFELPEILDIIEQVGEACACAHEAGIIHRDLKPANIMLTERGLVKVTDFGLAKTMGSEMDVTEAGTVVGTANYMSPEQGQGKELDSRSDIYSLGIVFFELLTGRIPFQADQPSAVLYMHVYEPPPPPSQFNQGLPPAVDRMVLRMLAKDPNDRPDDPHALLAELRGLRQAIGNRQVVSPQSETTPSPDTEMMTPSNISQANPMQTVPSGALTALVADDMPAVRTLYTRILEGMGFRVLEAEDGQQAIDHWAAEKPSLVLLDMNMPKQSGAEVLEERARQGLEGQVLVITARKDRETVSQAMGQSIAAYLTKPVNVNELRSRIETLMATPRGRIDIHKVAPDASTAAATAELGQSCQVLVYDPATYSRTLYRSLLQSMGHQAACAGQLEKVLTILKEDVPDLMVLAVSRQDPGSLKMLNLMRSKFEQTALILITEEDDAATREQLRQEHAVPILGKPVRLGRFRRAIEQELERSKPVARASMNSQAYAALVEEQISRDQHYTVFDLARELGSTLPEASRSAYASRLEQGSRREVETAVANLTRKLAADGNVDKALSHLRNAFMHGNVEVRNFALALLSKVLSPEQEVKHLLSMITDEDFRIRCKVITRLGELHADSAVETITRFLNDEVWKVRRAAADTLEQFELAKVLEPLLVFYSRNGDPLPDRLRKRLIDGTGMGEMELLDTLSRRKQPQVRRAVAGFLGELGSKLTVPILLRLLADPEAAVRMTAARSAAHLANPKVKERLIAGLRDPQREVQRAMIHGVQHQTPTLGASAFLTALGRRGARINDEDLRFFLTLDQKDNALMLLLSQLGSQSELNRRYLSLLLGFLFPDKGNLDRVVRLLGDSNAATRKRGLEEVATAVREARRNLSQELKKQDA